MDPGVAITVLGSGSAWPAPRPGCSCPQCVEARAEPRHRRTRTALLVETRDDVLLVDVGPDIMAQLERWGGAPRVDRVLITHTHADHVLGLDDLVHVRERRDQPLVVHAAAYHRERIAAIFPHLLRPERRDRIVFDDWEAGTKLASDGVVLEGFETGHRETFPTTAVLFHLSDGGATRRVAFATDMGTMPDASRALLRGIDLLVGDGSCLGAAGHGHPGTDDVLALARELGVGRVAFTHLGHVGRTDREIRDHLGPDVGLVADGDDLLAFVRG